MCGQTIDHGGSISTLLQKTSFYASILSSTKAFFVKASITPVGESPRDFWYFLSAEIVPHAITPVRLPLKNPSCLSMS